MIKQTLVEWSDDKGPRLGASLSYYTVFSMAPLLLLVISIAGLVFGPAAAEGRIFGELRGLLGSFSSAVSRSCSSRLKSSTVPSIVRQAR